MLINNEIINQILFSINPLHPKLIKNIKILVLTFIILLGNSFSYSQNSAIEAIETDKDLGVIENVYKISAEFQLKNNLVKNLFLLRADVNKGLTVRVAKKTIKPGDTVNLVVDFIPLKAGNFNEEIKLITSTDALPFVLNLRGNIKNLKPDDKTACFYFRKKSPSIGIYDGALVINDDKKPKDVSNKLPDEPRITRMDTNRNVSENKPKIVLDETVYKPNNILFLVDVSNSMRDSMKLPLMKLSLHYLINELRDVDKISFVTYADSVKLLLESVSGKNKKVLHELVDKLKGHGLTKGNKAILYSLDVSLRNYIPQGNNQIILATDGKFRFYSEGFEKWKAKQLEKKIILSTVGFGNDKEAITNLKEIAEKGNGSFIHIKKRNSANEQLLEEIKKQSKIQ